MRGKSDDAPKKFTKSNLPSKDCIVCNRPFEWRKKWERCWDEVKYCSERCRRDAKGSGGGGGGKEDSSSSGNNKFKFSLAEDSINYGKNVQTQEISPLIRSIFSSGVAALPPISIQRREIQNYQQNIRKSFGFAAALLAITSTASTIIPSAAFAAGTTRPTKKEIEGMFLDNDWDTKASVLRKSSYRRLDETPDNLYYTNPRIVEHIDEKAVLALTAFHGKQLKSLSLKLYNENKKLDILDICSSWTSHLPLTDYPVRSPVTLSKENRVVGVGMNREELSRNPQLSESAVVDLNINPVLPFEDESFDAILLQLSIGKRWSSLLILLSPSSIPKSLSFSLSLSLSPTLSLTLSLSIALSVSDPLSLSLSLYSSLCL